MVWPGMDLLMGPSVGEEPLLDAAGNGRWQLLLSAASSGSGQQLLLFLALYIPIILHHRCCLHLVCCLFDVSVA